ncbi:hypothetical protein NC651_020469 [Populus alba x Populus x berolinensis]|nr:hypothetical protein NC651_020469 [Populus alba x Populus x berolinensis]
MSLATTARSLPLLTFISLLLLSSSLAFYADHWITEDLIAQTLFALFFFRFDSNLLVFAGFKC